MHSLNILSKSQINQVQDVSQKVALHRPNSITKAMDGFFKYTHVQWKRTTLPMRIFVAYLKLCKNVLFIINI